MPLKHFNNNHASTQWWGPICSICNDIGQLYRFGDNCKALCTKHYKQESLNQKLKKLKTTKNKKNKMISIIAAIGKNNEIGRNNELLWYIPEDLKRFKKLTTSKVIIMGQKTFESLPIKPLPNRINLVITNDRKFKHEGVLKSYSIESAVKRAKNLSKKDEEIFIIGGGSIYKQFIDIADKLYITEVHESYEDADTFFPVIDKDIWRLSSSTAVTFQPDIIYSYTEYLKK